MISDEVLKKIVDGLQNKPLNAFEVQILAYELLACRNEKKSFIAAMKQLNGLDHCDYAVVLSGIKRTNEVLAKEIFSESKPEWDDLTWEEL